MELRYYRKGHGTRTRAAAFALVAVVLGAGCYELQDALKPRLHGTALGDARGHVLIAAGVFALGIAGAYAFMNRPRAADFLVDVDLELNKVTWANRREIGDAASVVFVTIMFLTVVMAFADVLFGFLARTVTDLDPF